MKKMFFCVWAIAMLFACDPPTPHSEKEDDLAVIRALMLAQEVAWNKGDIEAFMQSYWKNDSMRFIGKSGIQLGWQKTLDNYKRSYPSVEAMGQLKFENLHMELLDDSNAYVIGKWTLFRTSDTLSGHYSLLWKKINQHWVITADHSS